jgi:transcriptional regulator with PAS, ATPase and Fis domain
MMTVIDQIAGSPAPVLLVGERGTGKGLLARTIHDRSPRHAYPFVAIHCGASPEMFGSELFGYERGAFTRAAAVSKAGLFDRAHGGTLFLAEIAALEPFMQPMLVVALQRGMFRRLGGAKPVRTDVRIVSATNQDLAQMCREQRFRNDLYSELSVITVSVPSLHERGGEDIRLLAQYFLELAAAKNNRHVSGFTDEARRVLAMYPWPGNEQE